MPRKRTRNPNPNPERPMINIKLEDTHDDEEYGIQPGTASSSTVVPRQRRKDNEISQLTDSLTCFFTPVTGRRSSKPVVVYGGTIGSSSDEDDKIRVRKKIEEMKKKTQQPLSVDVNLTMDASAETSDSQSSKIQKNLTDSLSPYFSAMKEKRRTVKRGEFLSLSGVRQKAATTDHNSEGATTDSTVSPVVVMPERRKTTAGIGPVVGRRRTQNSASAALFSSPEKEINEDDDSLSNSQQRVKRPRTPKQLFSPKAERKMMQLQPTTSRNTELSPMSSDGEYYQQLKEKKKTRKKKSGKLGSREDGTLINGGIDDKENIVDDGSITISNEQRDMFEKIRRKVADEIDLGESTSGQYQEKVDKEPRLPRAIRIGRYQIDTWYSSPFPMEYIHVPILYMCDFCLKYVKTENMMINHLRKCKLYHPPGTEIYRKDNVSVFEVDGNCAKSYCQNLCLLSKSFLDHKTLFYDVEPFLFYIVTKNDSEGCHFVGYFSKEKYSQQKFNLSCIVTLPSYQKQGFGRFLIDFSFLLSRTEKMPGTPEKPLSDLGRISYASYWRTALFEWIHKMDLAKNKDSQFSIEDICNATGIAKFDIVQVFDALGWFKVENDNYGLFIDYELVNSHWEKVKKDKSRIWLDEKCLKWTPRNFSPSKDNFRSPIRSPTTPMKTPTSAATKTSTPSGVSLAAVGSTIKSGVSTSRRAPVGRNLKQKFEEEKREILEDSTNSESESSDEEEKKFRNRRKTWCKESINRKTRKRDDSPEDDTPKRGRKETGTSSKKGEEKRRNTLNGNSGNTNGDSRSKKNQRRGKMIFEDSSDKSSSSSTSSIESSDEDAVFTTGKPQKGKTSKPQKNQRKKQVPPQKGGNRTQIQNPGKVFPNNCETTKSQCESTKIKNDPIIEGASETNVGERLEKTENEQEAEEVAGVAVNVNDTGPSRGNYGEDEKDSTFIVHPSTTTTTTDDSDNSGGESDEEKKRDCQIDTRFDRMTPLSTTTDNSALSSRAETPRPIGDQPVGDDMINMGFVPDDDDQMSRFGAPSEENDGPPPLDLCPAAPLPIGDDDAPPMLNLVPESQQRNSLSLDVSHSIQEPDGYSTEDEAPPQLSPNFGKTEQDELSEKEKILEAMDRPPMAPVAAGIEIDEEEKLYHQQHSANAQVGIGSVGAPGSNQMMMQPPMSNMMTPTSQHPYSQGPGSMQQATPGSGGVPSCNPMYNQSTPEQQSQQNQQTFMSPSMQGMPSSVSSVHSVHNSSMEMPGPSQPSQVQQVQQQQQYVQQNDMMQNGPSTSMAQFGSPQNVQQPVPQPVVTQHQQQQQVQQIQQHRNSGGRESSSSRKQRQQQQQQAQQQQQQQLQQHQHMQQMQQQMNMQFHGYPPGYANYPYPQFDAFNYQYWQGGMFPQYYTPGRMPTTAAAATNQAWPGYQNGAVAAQGANSNPAAAAAAGIPPHQFQPNPAAAPFPGFPPDLYSNFYMKNG